MGLTARSDCCLHGARLSRPPKHSPSLLLFPPTAPVVCCQRLARGKRQSFCQFQILTIKKEVLTFFLTSLRQHLIALCITRCTHSKPCTQVCLYGTCWTLHNHFEAQCECVYSKGRPPCSYSNNNNNDDKKIYIYCFVFLYYTNEIRQFKSRQLKSNGLKCH